MQIFRIAAIPTLMLGAPAFAGNLAEPIVEPVITTPAPIQYAATPDWTGFYLGGQAGYGNGDVSGATSDYTGAVYGLHTGYMHDLGTWAIGAELDYDWADMTGPANTEIDEIARLKLLAGYKMGNGLLYGTIGAFQANVNTPLGDTDDNGALIGVGYKHKFTQNWVGGIEALYHEASDFGGVAGADLDATTITARISYQF